MNESTQSAGYEAELRDIWDKIRNLDVTIDAEGAVNVKPSHRRRDSGVRINFPPKGVKLSVDGKAVRMSGSGPPVSPLEFTVETIPVLIPAPLHEVGRCVFPKWWPTYLNGVNVTDIAGAWKKKNTNWTGSIMEHILCLKVELLKTVLNIEFAITSKDASTSFSLNHSKGGVLLKDEGSITASAGLLGSTSLKIIKTFQISPTAPEAILGKLAKPVVEIVLQAWMTEFAIAYVFKGAPPAGDPPAAAALLGAPAPTNVTNEHLESLRLPFTLGGSNIFDSKAG